MCRPCELAHSRELRDRNHDAIVCARYGLRPGEYGLIKEAQAGVCAICQRARGARRRLSVDHNHATGEVRGLLCSPCNQLLGHARDDPEFFLRCVAYLANPPARAVTGMRNDETD